MVTLTTDDTRDKTHFPIKCRGEKRSFYSGSHDLRLFLAAEQQDLNKPTQF
jgi:hypothetical protein